MYEVIEQNPYRLADDIERHRIPDRQTRSQSRAGVSFDSEYPCPNAGFPMCLQQAVRRRDMHFCQRRADCWNVPDRIARRADMTDLDPYSWLIMAIQKKIVIRKDGDRDCVYSASAYYMEMSTARMLVDLNITGEIGCGGDRKEDCLHRTGDGNGARRDAEKGGH